jgi:hypothetical protein
VLREGGILVLSFPAGGPFSILLDPYNLIRLARRVGAPSGPHRPFLRHPRPAEVLALCARGFERLELHRRGSLVFIWSAWLIDRLQGLRSRLDGRGPAGAGLRSAIRILCALMRADFRLRLGSLSYNTVLRLRKTQP